RRACATPASSGWCGRRSRSASPPSIPGANPERAFASPPVSIDSVAEFVAQLDGAGELIRITQPVSLNLELCEIADRVMKQPGGGKALLFEHPVLMNGTPSPFPVAINLFGSMRRMSMALGVERLDEISVRITEMLEMK